MKYKKSDFLNNTIEHIDIRKHNVIKLVDDMEKMAFTARDTARAAKIYDAMLRDKKCSVFLCLAGSIFSAGLKKTVVEMVKNNMVDAIISTGALMVDQDFFEAMGFKHYIGTPYGVDDNILRDLHIDRIYDTYIDEDELRVVDETMHKIAASLEPRPYSSREFIHEMGRYLAKNAKNKDSVVLEAYKKGVPIFVPAFSDCSAGFGLALHQYLNPKKHMSLDSAKDFLDLTLVKLEAGETGLLMIGGGVPKNFAQDTVVCAEMLGEEVPMHKYAVQVTVADVRDGALSSSTLKEASSWGKVSTTYEQMVYSEATMAVPVIAGYAYHKGAWKTRKARNFAEFLGRRDAECAKPCACSCGCK